MQQTIDHSGSDDGGRGALDVLVTDTAGRGLSSVPDCRAAHLPLAHYSSAALALHQQFRI